MNDRIAVILSTSDPVAARTGAMYAVNALKHSWMSDVRLIVFGPAQDTLLADEELQGLVAEYQAMETPAVACRFFAERDVLEVETPLLGRHTVPDVYIESMSVEVVDGASSTEHFLQTSPEFFMKRLLAHGSGSIYQIAKAFRQEEKSARHNCEFTLLEWYRVSYSIEDLMHELEQLVQHLLV